RTKKIVGSPLELSQIVKAVPCRCDARIEGRPRRPHVEPWHTSSPAREPARHQQLNVRQRAILRPLLQQLWIRGVDREKKDSGRCSRHVWWNVFVISRG